MSVDIACDQKYVDMCNKRDMKLTEEMDEKIRVVAVDGTNINRSLSESISVDNYQQTSSLTVYNLKGTQLDTVPALGITGISVSVDDNKKLILGIYINDKDGVSKWTCDIKTDLPFVLQNDYDNKVKEMEDNITELENQIEALKEEIEGLIDQ